MASDITATNAQLQPHADGVPTHTQLGNMPAPEPLAACAAILAIIPF